jgi:DNA repair protein RadC
MSDWSWLAMDVCAHWRDAPKRAKQVTNSDDVVKICREFAQPHMLLQEFFGVLCLNARSQPIGFAIIGLGGITSAAVDMRLVLKPPLLSNASAFVVTHNHPSGDATPSAEDIELTKRIKEAAGIVGLRLLDSVVVAENQDGPRSFSFVDHGLLA